MHIPFLDLKAQHQPLRAELSAVIQEVIDSSAFAGGPYVAKFEEDFAGFCQCPYAVGVGNGTDALWFTLLALGVGPGDEVITVPHTFIATAEAITFCGAKPVFVDIDEHTYTMDPALLERAITPRTRAIIPVHIFGQPADMDPILQIAHKYRLPVIEDACQAHGAEYNGRKAGSIGVAGCFSFYPGKNLGAFGEAGAVVTQSQELKEKIQMLRDHGQARKYHHALVGWNGRMDGIQAAVLRVKLKHLAQGNARRRAHAQLYNHLLEDGGQNSEVRNQKLEIRNQKSDSAITPRAAAYATHVYHLYVVRVYNRDAILKALAARGIHCGIHYPIPLHLQDAYHSLGLGRGSFPVAERCAAEFLSLPMYPELTTSQVETVARELKSCLEGNASTLERFTM